MLGSQAGRGSGHPPKPAVAPWTVGQGHPPLHPGLRAGLTLQGSRERGRRADLASFLDDVGPDGHDLVVEDVVLFYLAVDQRQVSPKAFAAQSILECTGVGVSNGEWGKAAKARKLLLEFPWSWAWMGSSGCSAWMPQESVGEISCAGGQPWENQFGGLNPSLAGTVQGVG